MKLNKQHQREVVSRERFASPKNGHYWLLKLSCRHVVKLGDLRGKTAESPIAKNALSDWCQHEGAYQALVAQPIRREPDSIGELEAHSSSKRARQMVPLMKTIPLTRGKVALISDRDFALVISFKWRADRMRLPDGKETWYATHTDKQGLTIRMHRLIMGFPPNQIDHKDGDTLNNQRGNLRLATQSQNNANARRRIDNTSGSKGVSWDKNKKRWVAQINCNGIRHWLGRFSSKKKAASAYAKAARRLHGQFARTK